jgi:hypothetical protein
VAVADLVNPHPAGAPPAETFSVQHAAKLERLIASLVVAAAAVVVFFTAGLSVPPLAALALAAIFAFGTSAWSTASRALWQHGPSMLLIAIALHLFARARAEPRLAGWTGIPVALSYVVRPTNAAAVVVFSLLVAARHRRALGRYLAFALPIAALFVACSWATYRSILPPYYQAGRLGLLPTFPTALAANLVSPGRGVFIYTPVFLLSLVGIAMKLRRRTFDALDASLVALLLLHWVAISSFFHWWGGWCYGPRFFSDPIPVFIYFLAPVVQEIGATGGWRRWLGTGAFAALALVGAAIHLRGATDRRVWLWNATPTDVDRAPQRVWDFRDPAFLR